MNSLNTQIGGSHYQLPIQPTEFIMANRWDFCAGNILKYITRWRTKGGLADLRKAIHYAQLRSDLTVIHEVQTPLCKIGINEYNAKNGIGVVEEQALIALELWVMSGIAADTLYRVWLVNSIEKLIATEQLST
jgi:hypothetical protein